VTQSALRCGSVNLSAIAAEIAQELQQAEPARRATFIIEDNIVAQADVTLLSVVLDNLLGNAWKFTSKQSHAEIRFDTACYDGLPVYRVHDNGVGFNMAYAHRLFGAFQRLHSPDEFAGTGIGLATVQRIIHRHGGRIWAEAAVGGGATFCFTLSDPNVHPSK
jgi:light-regulated signal transduction histidine kinase (bacteriophytochrome)